MEIKSENKPDNKLEVRLETFKTISTIKKTGKEDLKVEYERGEKKKKYKRKKKKLTQEQI